ncbi:MAG: NHL repeat-containing protein [Verrucomicrobia bacterium]|nr:NHL repeat-containing protein [Verrucomicrobiota bacterium]
MTATTRLPLLPANVLSALQRCWRRATNAGVIFGLAVFLSGQARGAIGDLYEADYGSGAVYRFDATGARSTFVSGLLHPSGLAFDWQGNLFVADAGGNAIYKVAPNGTKTLFASGLNNPFGLVFDSNGNLFESDNGTGRILKFTPTGTASVFAAGLNGPAGLGIDVTDKIYEADFNSGTVFAFSPTGAKTTLATGLSSPDGLFSNGAGDLLTGNPGNGEVIAINPAGTQTLFAGGFVQPTGVTVDLNGNTFISDNNRGTLTRITPSGVRATFATGLINPQYLAIEHPTGQLENISTRAFVGTGEQVLIGGFIISGTAPKQVLIRGLGPTLAHFGVSNVLSDPTLTLHNSAGGIVAFNNDWQSAPNAGQIPPAYRPPDPRESAILITLPPGSYTAIEAGNGGTTGAGLVEVYDMNLASLSQLSNISSRGLVQSSNQPMIGGFVATAGNGSSMILVRALGPTLSHYGVTGTLPSPVVRLANANGQTVAFNAGWKTTQEAAIQATGIAPPSDLESAILITVTNAPYTAVVTDRNGASGIALVEVYHLR